MSERRKTKTHDHSRQRDNERSFAGPADQWDDLRGVDPADIWTAGVQRAEEEEAESPEPKQLEPGRARMSLRQLRNIGDKRTRWQEAEHNTRERWGGGPERPYRTDEGALRKVDCPVDTPFGTIAVEVKMYQQFRRVELPDGSKMTQRVEVPLSPKIQEQIDKDVALRGKDPRYHPHWDFLDAGPSPELRAYLTEKRIVFTEHNRPKQGDQ